MTSSSQASSARAAIASQRPEQVNRDALGVGMREGVTDGLSPNRIAM